MTTEYANGNAFEGNGEAVVVTVNCVGAMGRGIAEECKRRMPWLYKTYRQWCSRRKILPGRISVPWCLFEGQGVLRDALHHAVVLFPTKDNWKRPSQIEWIRSGMEDLVVLAESKGWTQVDMTLPGTANGWIKDKGEVTSLVREILKPSKVHFVIWDM